MLLIKFPDARAGGQFAAFGIAPQRDQKLAGERHNHDFAQPAFGPAGALHEPATERALRLEAQPAPGQLHQDAAHTGIAVFAAALFVFHAAALKRRAGHADIARHGAAIAERTTGQHLANQHRCRFDAEANQAGQQLDHALGALRPGDRHHLVALGLDLAQLVGNQAVTRHQPPQLRHRVGRQSRIGVSSQRLQPRRGFLQARLEARNTMQAQQVLDAVLQLQPLADQPLPFAARPTRILFCLIDDARHRAHPRLAAQPSQQCA